MVAGFHKPAGGFVMANIIPMAGKGSRFEDEGYQLPKPLIPVSGISMVIRVIRNMPPSDKWIFLVRQEHIDDYNIDKVLKKEVPAAIIVPVKELTEGQACTCLLAEPYLDPDEPVLIGACDNSFLYDKEKYQKLINDKNVDSIVWTFTRHEDLKENPQARGWCILDKQGPEIKDMSVKVPISDDPFNDHAVVATFYFRKAKDFIDATNLMIKENYRINNEFYIDSVPIFIKKLGKKSVIFDIDFYLDWGTPKNLYDYQKIEHMLKTGISPPNLSEKTKKLLINYIKESECNENN